MFRNYEDLHLPADKEIESADFREKFTKFKSIANTETTFVYGQKHFVKERIKLEPHAAMEEKEVSTLDLIYTVEPNTVEPNKRKKFHSFVWHAKATKIKEAVDSQISKTYSLTSKVISALGEYRKITHRGMAEGIISNRYHVKEILLEHYQKRFRNLQRLEFLVNSSSSKEDIEKVFKKYRDKLKKINDFKRFQEYSTIKTYNFKSFYDTMENGIGKEDSAADAFLKQLNVDDATRATGGSSILAYVREQVVLSLSEMQRLNNNFSDSRDFGFALTKGDLNSCIVEAQALLRDHLADPHNVLTKAQCGIFGEDDEIIAYDSAQQGLSPDQEQDVLLEISFIEKMNEIADVTDPKKAPKIKNINGPIPLKVVKSRKWASSDDFKTSSKRFGAFCLRILFGFIDLGLAVITRPMYWTGIKWLQWPSKKLTELATFDYEPPFGTSLAGSDLRKKAHRRIPSLRMRAGDFLYQIVDNVYDFIKSLGNLGRKITFGLALNVQNDYADAEEEIDFNTLIKRAEDKVGEIVKYKADQLLKITGEAEKPSTDLVAPQQKFAVPEFIPSAGEFNDISNGLGRGLATFFGFFLHHIYDKHPFLGMVFTTTYAFGGLSVLFPSAMSFLGPVAGASQAVGSAMAQGKFSGSLGAGFTLAKGSVGLVELVMHGPKSWFVTGMKEVEKDPAIAIVYTGAAIALGHALTYDLPCGEFSKYLQDDTGTLWPVVSGLVGAKLSLIIFELFTAYEQGDLQAAKVAENKIKQFVRERYIHKFPNEKNEAVISGEVERLYAGLMKPENQEAMRKIYEPFKLIAYLQKNQAHLPHLDEKTKHQFMRKIQSHFPAKQAEAIRTCFYPEPPRSIVGVTLNIIGAYPTLILRCLIAAVASVKTYYKFGNIQPLKSAGSAFAKQLAKDGTRVLRMLSLITKNIAYASRVMFKMLGDVFINSLIARPIALITKNFAISNAWHKTLEKVDVFYERARQFLSTPVDAATKAVTHPHFIDTLRNYGPSSSSTQVIDGLLKEQSLSNGNNDSIVISVINQDNNLPTTTKIDNGSTKLPASHSWQHPDQSQNRDYSQSSPSNSDIESPSFQQ